MNIQEKKLPYNLRNYAYNVVSQHGEDGIIESIFSIIPENAQNHWCVELGAWDGKLYSNTWNLIKNKNWKGVLIEGSKNKFVELQKNYEGHSGVYLFHRLVDFHGENSLESIISQTPIPADFDLLSIDIDGNEYHVWNSLEKYSPKVVVVEFNRGISNHIEFVQRADMNVYQGSSLRSYKNLAGQRGYELVCTTMANAFFVKKEYYPMFNIPDNSLDVINPEGIDVSPSVFVLWDGTVVMTKELLFYQPLKITQTDMQVFPPFFLFDDENESSAFKKRIRYYYIRLWRIKSRLKKIVWKFFAGGKM
jgi:hypothetical protein